MKHIWIIDELSSTAIFYRNYTTFKIDPDLVSGLLSAMNNFSEVEFKQGLGIESISMAGLSWVYVDADEFNILFIAADDKSTDHNITKSRLEVIRDTFIADFNLSPENWNKKYRGNVTQFEGFKEIVDTLINQWKQAEIVMNAAELFDLIGVFQQIYNLLTNIINVNIFGNRLKDLNDNIKKSVKDLENSEEYSKEEELKKIDYDPQMGFNIMSINPANVNPILLERILLKITEIIKGELTKKLGKIVVLGNLEKEIFPYILGNWSLINKLHLDEKILSLFLIN